MAEELARQLISGLASPTKLIRDMAFNVLISLYENDEKLETVKTHLTKWKSGHSDWQMGRMSQWKAELDEILEG